MLPAPSWSAPRARRSGGRHAPPTWLGLAPMGPLAIRSLRVVGLDEMLSATERSGEVRRRSPAVPRHPEAASAMGRLIPGRPSLRLIDGGRAG